VTTLYRMTHPKFRSTLRSLLAAHLTLIILISTWAMPYGADGANNTASWYQWHGPNRNGTTSEDSGWPSGWPPKELWGTNVGFGLSGPILVNDRVYAMGWNEGQDCIHCLEAAGENGRPREIWVQTYACRAHSRKGTRFPDSYQGPMATPAMDMETGYLYTLSCDGDLRCWEAYNRTEPGRLRWAVNLFSDYKVTGGELDYGFFASPLLYGDWVIVEVGDNKEGAIWAFGKSAGKVAWKSAHCGNRANASPALVFVDETPWVTAITSDTCLVIRIDHGHEGEPVVERPWRSVYNESSPSPIVSGSKVLFTMCESSGRRTQLMSINSLKKNDYTMNDYTKSFFTCTSTAALNKGNLYFRSGKKVRSFELDSGRMNWESGEIFDENHPMGAEVGNLLVTAGDDKMIVWDGIRQGNLVLAEASPGSGWKELCRMEGILKRTKYEQGYPHLAFCDGRIVCRNMEGDIVCLSVRQSH
jgi:outer membrane protein assembly factor BamB